MSLGKLKERLQEMKDKIDEAEQRAQEAKSQLKEAEDNAERNQIEADGIRRRIKLLSKEYTKVLDRLEELEAKLGRASEKGEKEEEARRNLEENEMEGDEKVAEIETNLREALEMVEETQHRLTEAKRKEIVLRKDNKTAVERYTIAERKVDKMSSNLENIAEKAKNLEMFEDESFEREQINEEKIIFLEGQVKEEEQRLEDAEGREKTMKRHRDGIEDEIGQWQEKMKELQKEMENLTSIVDDI